MLKFTVIQDIALQHIADFCFPEMSITERSSLRSLTASFIIMKWIHTKFCKWSLMLQTVLYPLCLWRVVRSPYNSYKLSCVMAVDIGFPTRHQIIIIIIIHKAEKLFIDVKYIQLAGKTWHKCYSWSFGYVAQSSTPNQLTDVVIFVHHSNGVEWCYAMCTYVCTYVCMTRNVTGNKRLNLEAPIFALFKLTKWHTDNIHPNHQHSSSF